MRRRFACQLTRAAGCWFTKHRRRTFEQRAQDVVAPRVPSEFVRLAVAGVWVRATRKQQLNHRQVSSVDSHDERKASARVHVRPSIHKQANNRERAVVRGDAQARLACLNRSGQLLESSHPSRRRSRQQPGAAPRPTGGRFEQPVAAERRRRHAPLLQLREARRWRACAHTALPQRARLHVLRASTGAWRATAL